MSEFLEIMSVIGIILSALSPIIVIILTILVKKGKVAKETKEEIEEVLGAVTTSIDKFKEIDKDSSKKLTGTITESMAEKPKVGEALDKYLDGFGLNK